MTFACSTQTIWLSDPVTFLTAPALLTLVALLACLAPAVRALRVDPVAALRSE